MQAIPDRWSAEGDHPDPSTLWPSDRDSEAEKQIWRLRYLAHAAGLDGGPASA